MSALRELIIYLKHKKKIWLYPMVIAIFLLSALIVLKQIGDIVPFIYSIF